MQTFVHEGTDLELGFKELDYRRLGKQRVETWQILNVLRCVDNAGNPKEPKGWVNHPAVKMWEGYVAGLSYYGVLCCAEWIRRGYNDTMLNRFQNVLGDQHPEMPAWLYDPAVAKSHRSNLIRKEPEHYLAFWPDTPNNLEYIWPQKEMASV